MSPVRERVCPVSTMAGSRKRAREARRVLQEGDLREYRVRDRGKCRVTFTLKELFREGLARGSESPVGGIQ